MAVTIQLMLSNPVDGKEDEFNEWYDNVHLPEVLAVPGMRSAQRFAFLETGSGHHSPKPAQRYLVIYEMEGDVEAITGKIAAAAQDGTLHMSDALDLETLAMWFWSPIGPKAVKDEA